MALQTEVIFQAKSKGKGNIDYIRGNKPVLRFINGVLKTSKREDINDLLHSDLMKRNLIKCVTPMDLVDKWLRNETPDRLTTEVLETVSQEGLIELAKIARLKEQDHDNQPAVIRSMVKDMPVSNAVSFIISKYKTEKTEFTDWLQQAMEPELVYKSSRWYKYRKSDEKNPEDDLTIGGSEQEAQQWCIDNQKEIEERLKE